MHLMIDLETLSLEPEAVITQIGWAEFDPDISNFVQSSGCFKLNPQEQINRGRKISWETFCWWMKQEENARYKMRTEFSLGRVADTLRDFVFRFDWNNIEGVWANGIMFDLVLLENLFKQYEIAPPWHYRTPRDFKTLRALRPNIIGPKPEIAHSAEHDAIAQAKQVQLIMADLSNANG